MATIRQRTRSDGGTTYTVTWRAGGTRGGKQESETFPDNPKAAETFRGLVDMADQQWPRGWVRGKGFVEQQPGRGRDMPLTDWCLRYASRLTGVDDRTRADYAREIRLHLSLLVHTLDDNTSTPATVANVTADDVADWVRAEERGEKAPEDPTRWERRPASPKSIANRHGLLYGALQAAVEADPPLRSNNPCSRTRLPRIDDGDDEMVFLERAEYQRVRHELSLICGGDAVDLADILVGTGLRWSECTALQVRDLNLSGSNPTLRVQRAWKRQEDNSKTLGPPKTKKGRRTIALSPGQVEILLRNIVAKRPDDFVMTNANGRVWHESNFRNRRWRLAVKAAQRKGFTKSPRVHDLRHTHVSWLIASRIPLPAIQARLGHESITTTVDRYGHLEEGLSTEIAAAVDRAMSGGDDGGGLRLVSG